MYNFFLLLLAQYTDGKGIGLGGLFDGLKVNAKDFEDIINKFKSIEDFKEYTKDGVINWDDLSKSIGITDTRLRSYLETLDDGKGHIDNTSASVEGMSAYLEKSGNGFQFAAIKATLLNTALNAGIFLAATVAVQTLYKELDNYIRRNEIAIKKTEEAQSRISDLNSEYETHKKTVEELASSYEKLSKGVDKATNTNLSLSDEDYQSYLDITNQLAEAFPTLQKTLDDNGNAILTLGQNGQSASQDLEDLLKAEEDLNNFKIAQDIDDLFGGVKVKVEEAKKAMEDYKSSTADLGKGFETLKQMSTDGIDLSDSIKLSGDTSTQAGIEYYNSILNSIQEFYKTLDSERRIELSDIIDPYKIIDMDNNGVFDVYLDTTQLTDNEKSQLQNIIKEQSSEILPLIQDELSTAFSEQSSKQQEAELAWKDFVPSLVSTMKSSGSFKGLADEAFGSDIQNFAIDLVSNLDISVAEQMDRNDPYKWVRNNIILPLTKLDDSDRQSVTEAYSKLLKLNPDDLSEKNQSAIDTLISQLAEKLGNSEANIRLNLGFNIDEDLQTKYDEAIKNAVKKFGGSKETIQDIFTELGIDTSAEIDKWNEIAESVNNVTEAKIKFNQEKITNIEPQSFDISSYQDSIDDIQSVVETLRGALDSFNQGELDESDVIDLMQQFPDLAPYVDLAADGFGNLSQGLSVLIAQQPTALINSLEQLKLSLRTDEERAQVDELINSLQLLSSYGDTGMEAYAASIGSTWNDTANVIESVTTQFENLAKVQEAVAGGLTMSIDAATELAKMYPEILTNAEFAANGQVTLNEDVVKSILAGDQSIVQAQITKLEADKAVLTSKKAFAEAQLNMLKQVGEGEGQISKEVADYRIQVANALLEQLINAGVAEDDAYAAVAANMAGNMDEYNRIVGEVAQDTSVNMDASAALMAKSIDINTANAKISFDSLMDKVHQLADAIAAAANGERAGLTGTSGGGGSTSLGGITATTHSGNFTKATIKDLPDANLNLDKFQSQLELDIKGYTDAIANIDSQIEVLKNLQQTFTDTANSANGGIGGHNYANKIKDLEKEKKKINDALDDAKSGSTKKVKDEYEELFDFFQRRATVLQDAFDNLGKGIENVVGSAAKNKLVSAQIGIVDEQLNNYTDALAMYKEKADEALSGIDSTLKDKIINGSVSLTDFIGDGNEEVVDALKNYQEWSNKIADCTQKLEELKTQLRQLELQKFNNIIEEFTDQFDLYENSNDLIDKQIALFEEAGELIGESFYNKQIEQSEKQLKVLEKEKASLVKQLNDALSSGKIQKGTDEWLEMQKALDQVDQSILDCETSIEKYNNALLKLNWDIFDRIQTEFSNLSSEMNNLIGLFDNFNDIQVSDGKGTWTNQAIATLGLYAQQYELARYQVDQYSDAIDQLNEDYVNGKYSTTEYIDKLAELKEGQWDAVNSTEAVKDAIVDLNKTRVDEEIESIEDEIDAYKKLVDAQIESIEATEELRKQQETLAEKSKAVTDIDRQLAAMANDDSAATRAKRKLLEQQRAEAQKDLEDTQREYAIDSQVDALNKNYDAFEEARNAEIEALQLTLNNEELLIAQSLETVKANTNVVAQEIALLAQEHGIVVSDAVITPWQNGEGAIASYGATLSANSSTFVGNLTNIANGIYALQAQADATATSISNMFGTRADTLVNELTSSYSSAENLNNMTNTLQNSLVNTLERGYDISSITSGMNSIASAATNAANATRDMYGALSGAGSSSIPTGNSSKTGTASSSTQKTTTAAAKYAIGLNGQRISDKMTQSDAYSWMDKYNTSGKYYIIKYHKGGIVAKDDNNPLNNIAKSVGEDTLVAAKEGESILTPVQTEMVSKFVKILDENPDALNSQTTLNISVPEFISRNNIPQITELKQPNVTMHYDSLVTVNGDVNDTKHFLGQIETVSKKCTEQMLNDINRKFRLM